MLAAGWGTPYDSYYRAVVYDPDTGTWSNTGSLSVPRGAGQQATLLQDGRVLVSGGTNNTDFSFPLHSVESYDPELGQMEQDRSPPRRTMPR